MVDIFGGRISAKAGPMGPRGSPGARGPPGPSGSLRDLVEWMPKSSMRLLEKYDQIGSFFIENIAVDLEVATDGVVEKWKNRNQHSDGNFDQADEKGTKKVIQINEARYVLKFNGNKYANYNLPIFNMSEIGDSGYTCISFKVDGDDDYILMTNRINDNILSSNADIWVNKNKIEIDVGDEKHMIKHNCSQWTVLFISFSLKSDCCKFKYSVNDVAGEFTVSGSLSTHNGLILGGDNQDEHNFVGDIGGLFIYGINEGGEVPEEMKIEVMERLKVKK